ncbi:MAG: hypothetical protein QNJ06_07695, partial [Kiloniellales bacterium]|nr:hypothetical protein [Kiloniellales bacterium]
AFCALLVMGLGILVVSAGPASAQSIIRAVYRFSLTDPDSGATFYANRLSVRSWSQEERCKIDSSKSGGMHADAVRSFGIMNGKGEPLEVKIDSVECVFIRK